jgi:hypothetical protein
MALSKEVQEKIKAAEEEVKRNKAERDQKMREAGAEPPSKPARPS